MVQRWREVDVEMRAGHGRYDQESEGLLPTQVLSGYTLFEMRLWMKPLHQEEPRTFPDPSPGLIVRSSGQPLHC